MAASKMSSSEGQERRPKASLQTPQTSLSYAERTVLKTYRWTSPQLKRRSQEQIESDSLIRRSLRLGKPSVWCFWIAFVGYVGTGALIVTFAPNVAPSLLLLALSFLALGGNLGTVIMWIIGRISLSFALDAGEQVASQQIEDFGYRDVQEFQAQREVLEAEMFRRNLNDRFLLRSLRWNGIRVFDDGEYNFAPRVNVLLGKNGYGKTLLFRTLIGLLQRDTERSGMLMSPAAEDDAQLVVEIARNGELQQIIRDPVYFVDTCGKIPVLAIPDSRFVNKSVPVVSSSPTGHAPLSESGAHHYLTQEPYENTVNELLTQIGIDYVENKRRFDQPIFHLIESVVRELTEDEDFRFASIDRVGRTGFQIMVHTAGSRDIPVPIQAASQGTFSVVAIFALIYSFLRSLDPKGDGRGGQGIVLIDEIDAHLHPSWQRRILGVLTSRFPRVQFIVSAHSPLVVAGCDEGEVAVIRRDKERDRFQIRPYPARDFLGANVNELYKEVFEIQDTDRLYEEYSMKATSSDPEKLKKELAGLRSKPNLSPNDEERISALAREQRLMERALEVREERLKQQRLTAHIARVEDELEIAQRKLSDAEEKIRSLERKLSAPSDNEIRKSV